MTFIKNAIKQKTTVGMIHRGFCVLIVSYELSK